MAMDPERGVTLARKADLAVADLRAEAEPFALRVGDADAHRHADARRVRGRRLGCRLDAAARAYEHVAPAAAPGRIAKTILTLPHADVEVTGTLALPGRTLQLDGARGGQAHLWGSKHAQRWAWAHCNDFRSVEGEPRPDTFFDGVSVFVPRFGREIGPELARRRALRRRRLPVDEPAAGRCATRAAST